MTVPSSREEAVSVRPRDFVSVRGHSFVVHRDDRTVVRFDPEGRWFSASLDDRNVRRGFDGRVRETRRASRDLGRLDVRWWSAEAATGWDERVREVVREAIERLGSATEVRGVSLAEATHRLERALGWDVDRFAEQARRFAAIHHEPPVLPPDLPLAVAVELASRPDGGTLRADWQLDAHLEAIRELMAGALAMRRGVWLAGPAAWGHPTAELERCIARVRERLPEVSDGTGAEGAVHGQLDANARPRAACEWARLTQVGLGRLWLVLPPEGSLGHTLVNGLRERQAPLSLVVPTAPSLASDALAARVHAVLDAASALGLGFRDRIVCVPLFAPDAEGPLDGGDSVTECAERVRESLPRGDGPRVGRYRADDVLPY